MNSENELIPKKYDKLILSLASVFIGVLLTIGVFFLFQHSYQNIIDYPLSNQSTFINSVVMARSIDPLANAVNPTTQFNSKTDKSIYMILSLKNATTSDKLTYVRYYNGNYIDSEQASPSSKNTPYFYFNWNKTGSLYYPSGNYLIKVYLNGTLEDAVSYTVT